MGRSRTGRFVFPVAALLVGLGGGHALAEEPDRWRPTDGWHTLHHDVMRSGRTAASPAAPFSYAWHREYWDELIAPEAEPIVAEGLVFFGTFKGLLRGLDADTGEERWKLDLGGPVKHSPCYADGKVFAATMAGVVVAVEAKTGKEVWRFRAARRGGFAASPAVWRGGVFLGDRAGDLYCLEAATGAVRWKAPLGTMILQTASVRDGKVAVAAEDLVPRQFDAATGKQLWAGKPMDGATVRGYYPVFWGELVVWRTDTNTIELYQDDIVAATEDGAFHRDARKKHGWTKAAEELIKTLPGRYTDEKYQKEQEHIRKRMAEGKHPRSFYALRVSDGTEPLVFPVGYHASENGYSVPAGPPVDAEGRMYVLYKSVYSEWTYPIRSFDAVGFVPPFEAGKSDGLPQLIRGITRGRDSFPVTCDECNNLVVAGDKLYDTHDHLITYMEMPTRKVVVAWSSHHPELWGGVAKCIASDRVEKERPGAWRLRDRDPEESLHFSIQWNGPAQGSVAFGRDRLWWNSGSMIVCVKGTVSP
jgi:outer membrane protein assembly factor BamB